jgi:hypothetical protein
MVQETGETRDAIMEDVQKRIEDIINHNKGRTDPYWIVLFAKPYKGAHVDGKHTLVQHVKAYSTRPNSMVGQIVAKVDNNIGRIQWEVNMPQRPFDFDALRIYGAKSCDEVVTETTTIPGAYITQ